MREDRAIPNIRVLSGDPVNLGTTLQGAAPGSVVGNAMHRSKLTLILLLVSATVLVGCSDEPSSDEMHKLVDEHVAKQLKAHSVKGFKGFIDFRKQGCVKTKDKEGYFDC